MNIGDSILIIDGPWEGTTGVVEEPPKKAINASFMTISVWNGKGLLYVLPDQIIPINVKDNPEHFI